jgi:protein phosphatase PTC7
MVGMRYLSLSTAHLRPGPLSRAQILCKVRRSRGGRHHERYLASSTAQPERPPSPFKFDSGVALFAKRTPRPFPPPFMSPPSASFSDALSTHHKSRDRRAFVHGDLIRGQTNGDDAVYASDCFICANDGVGAWAARPRGHAGLVHYLIT